MARRNLPAATGQGALFGGCPKCASAAPALLWAQDPNTGTRRYRCPDCRGTWSVDGVQTTLSLGALGAGDLRLTIQVVRETR